MIMEIVDENYEKQDDASYIVPPALKHNIPLTEFERAVVEAAIAWQLAYDRYCPDPYTNDRPAYLSEVEEGLELAVKALLTVRGAR